MAHFHFTQLVAKQPTNWEALIRLIEILRRTGNIEEGREYLDAAEKRCDNPTKNPKLLYCNALYQWYSGNLNGALRNFNGARQDPELGLLAIYNMIEICLNPDDETAVGEFLDGDDIEYTDSRSMALKTADRLLRELKQKLDANGEDTVKYRLLTNFRLLATMQKLNIERALEDFVAITSENAYKDNIGSILGMATAYTLLKQPQRAKNQLKRLAKTPWSFEHASHLERAWLLLADHHLNSSKAEAAAELGRKVARHNASCAGAFERIAMAAEREQRHLEAAECYERCWRLGGRADAAVGYRLARCLVKRKEFARAVEVAHQVLRVSPGHPRVGKDVLEKCMAGLRV